jgi:histidine ammonia-lyase
MTISLTGNDLTIDAIVRVANHGERVEATPVAYDQMRRSRAVVDRLAAQEYAVYGVTTGLGALKNVRVPIEEIAQYQQNILMSHAVGIGPEYPQPVVRAIMLTRLNGMARGGAGVQLAVFDLLLALLNAGITPVVPSRGSVGMSDLAPLAHMALPIIAHGEVDYAGRRMPSGEALALAGLQPVTLGAKDALALCSANSASVGHGALVVAEALRLLQTADIAAALSLEAFQGNVGPLDARAHAVRPFAGQRASAAHIRELLHGSSLWTPDPARSIQDPLSFRCTTQVHGAARDALRFVIQTLEMELNASGDNPVVLPDDGVIVSNGNFHSAGVAMAFDLLAIALAQVTSLGTSRVIRLMEPALSGLPLSLTTRPGTNSGFGVLQKTITSLNSEIRFTAAPGSLYFTPIAGDIEDHATMTTLCVSKAGQIVDTARRIQAIELLSAAQAVNLRESVTLGEGTRAAYEVIRSVAPFSPVDRLLMPDVEAVYQLLADGRLAAAAETARVGLPIASAVYAEI